MVGIAVSGRSRLLEKVRVKNKEDHSFSTHYIKKLVQSIIGHII